MPNLFSALPVEILRCVLASTIGIDAHRYGRDDAGCDGTRRKELELRLGLDVEAVNAGGKREIHLARGLADA